MHALLLHAARNLSGSVRMGLCMSLAGNVALPKAGRNRLVLLQRLRAVRALLSVCSELQSEEISCTLSESVASAGFPFPLPVPLPKWLPPSPKTVPNVGTRQNVGQQFLLGLRAEGLGHLGYSLREVFYLLGTLRIVVVVVSR